MFKNQLQKTSPFEPKFHTRLIIILWGLVIITPLLTLVRINIKEAQAAWSPSHGAWMRRQMLNVVNSSTVTLHTNTTVAVTVDTKTLVGQGRLRSDCSDIRVLYQPDSSTNTELTRHLVFPGGGNCGTSTATKVYFSLQADITTTDTTNDYYIYFDNPQASIPSNTDNAFDIGNKDALLVCPFEGTTTCAAGETPSTESGTIRYSQGKSALSFDGLNDHVTFSSISETYGDSALFTAEFWIKPNNNSYGNYKGIIGSSSSAWNAIYLSNSTTLKYSVTGDGGGETHTWTITDTTNQWSHFALVVDKTNNSAVLFQNGTSLGQKTLTKSSSTSLIYIGGQTNSTEYLSGQIDEVRISNVARYTANFTPSTTPFVRDEYTKLLYHFDENGDDPRNTGKVIDDSGNGNHGTITGAKYAGGIVGIDNPQVLSSSTGSMDQAYASHNGIFIEEGTTNKITNPSFEHGTYNTNWTATTGTLSLQDEFLDTRAAGAVNGTSTTGGQTRLVYDTENKLSIGSGVLNYTGGKTSPSYGNPGYWITSEVSRVAGKTLLTQFNVTNLNGSYGPNIGWDNSLDGYVGDNILGFTGASIQIQGGQAYIPTTSLSNIRYAQIMRSSGYYYFIKGGGYTNWTLAWFNTTSNATARYAALSNYAATYTSDFLRVPTNLYVPTPLAYDTFTRGDGVIGSSETTGPDSQETPSLAWTGGAISSNKLAITPTIEDSEKVTNGTFDSDTSGWTAFNATVDSVAGGQSNNGLRITATGQYAGVRQTATTVSGNWYLIDLYHKNGDRIGHVNYGSSGGGSQYGVYDFNDADWNRRPSSLRATGTSLYLWINSPADMQVGQTTFYDEVSVKPLTLSSLFSTVPTSDKDIIADTSITSATTGTPAGIVTNLNSASSPTAGIVAYLTRTDATTGATVTVDKFTTATTWSNVQAATTVTYVEGATLRVVTYHSDASTLKVRVYYNNALVGSEQTVTDASIRDNTIHGLFSTYSGNTFDNFSLFARGSDGEYSIPGEFDGTVTVTEETSSPYVKFGSSSMKAVATYDGTVTTSINPGNTNTHTLSAYVYDGTTGNIGGTVSSSIASLVFNSVPVTTTYTDMGGGWWRLTYSGAGVNSSGNYGVEVMSGKTVYIDGVQLEEKAYATTYADGSLDSTGKYDWSGTANDSTSTRTISNLQYATSGNINASVGSISFWVKPATTISSISSDQYLIDIKSDASNRISLFMDASEDDITLNTNGTETSSTGITMASDSWNHFVITYDFTNDQYKVYKNGVATPIISTTTSLTSPSLPTNFVMGADSDNANHLNGMISDIRTSSSVYTSDEVSDLYYSGLTSKSDTYATVTVDNFQDSTVLGTTTTNKITNPSFENSTFSTNWTTTQEYTLQDEFTDTQGAGSVNGTSATDLNGNSTGSTRTATDSESKLSIGSGVLLLDKKTSPTSGDPGTWYPAINKEAGKIFIGHMNYSTIASGGSSFGFDTNTSGGLSTPNFFQDTGGLLRAEGESKYLTTLTTGIDYNLGIVLRSSGAYYYIKGGPFTNWTLLWIRSDGGNATLYPAITNYTSVRTSNFVRIPTSTFLPSPLAYDTFTTAGSSSSEANGPDGQVTPVLSWTGGTKAGGKMSISPTLGSEQVNDVGFDNPANWLLGTGWNVADSITTKTPGSSSYLHNTVRPTIGNWYQLTGTVVRNAGNVWLASGGILGYQITSSGTHTNTMRADNVSYHGLYANASFDGTVDDFSAKPITTSSLFSTVSTSDKDIIASTDITYITGTQAGLVTNLDSTSSPNNFLIAYLTATSSGAYINLSKNVGGTYTNLINNASFTYVSGATLRVITYHSDASTLKVRVYYNNALVGSEQTVTDASIRDNTIHGLFSTYSGNTFDNFTLFARGSDGEYSTIPDDPSTHLTAEENTTNTYNKSGGKSVKLTNTNTTYPFEYVTSINPGNTNTHTLSMYVKETNGAKVDSSVAKLVFNGSVVTPSSYTQVDGNWWRLTYSAATANSSADYGVEVQGGKTVYMDSVQLEEGASATNYIDGSLGRGFEWTGTANNSTSQRLGGEGKGEDPTSVYHFDEGYGTTANDSSINLNALTISGATWSNTSGNGGKYLTFDGTNDYLSRSFDTDFDFGSDPFTISGFFRHTSTSSGQRTILARQNGSVGYKVYMNSSGYICFSVNSDSACTTTSYADSKWHTFSGVRGTENIKLFIDGVELALTNTSSPATVNGANSLYVGIDSDGTSNPWTGDLDELTIYPYARTQTQLLTDNLGNENTTLLASSIYDPLTQGLVGWWKMDESSGTLTDSSGNGYTGTWSGTGASHYTTGKFGNGGGFNGTDDYITSSANIPITGNQPRTISAWFKTVETAPEKSIIQFGGLSVCGRFNITIQNRNIKYLNAWCDNNNVYTFPVGAITAWNLVTATYDGTTYKLFINGVLVNTIQASFNTTLGVAKIGAIPEDVSYPRYFVGNIDDARIYNRSLNNEEVMALYKYAPGPVAHWSFDEGSGLSAYDKSGNGNTGTLTNGPTWTQGKIGKAMSLDGSDDYATIASPATNLNLSRNYTLSAYIKTNAIGSLQGIISHGSGSYYLRITAAGKLEFLKSQTLQILTGNTTLQANTWYFITATISEADTTTIVLYLNGKNDGSTTSTATFSSNSSIQIGSDLTSSERFKGVIDDVKIYNYARTQEQIVSDMNATHPAPGSPVGSAVAHYKFDEGYGTTANNSGSGGSSLNGTLTGMSSPATTTSGWTNNGKFGKALSFDGVDDYVSISKTEPAELTISAWIHPSNIGGTSSVDGQRRTIVNNFYSSNGYILDISQQKFRFYTNTSGISSTTVPQVNKWYHVVATFDGTTRKLFVDGKQEATGAGSITYSASSVGRIGINGQTSNDKFNGFIDEVKIYNYALSSEDVKTEYNKGAALVLGSNTDSGKVIASDSFNKASMGTTEVGNYTWSGSTWSTANGKAINTPVTGGDVAVDGGIENWTSPTNATSWTETLSGSSTINQESSDTYSGSYAVRMDVDSSNSGVNLDQYFPTTSGYWYEVGGYVKSNVAGKTAVFPSQDYGGLATLTTSYALKRNTIRSSAASYRIFFGRSTSASSSLYMDGAYAKELTFNNLISSLSTTQKDVINSVDITLSSGMGAGVASNLNSTTAPTAGLIAWRNENKVYLDKFTTATTWTNLISSSVTYSAGATLKLVTYHSASGTIKASVYYNGALVGTEQTITDTEIVNNSIHGIFSTASETTLDNFKLETNTQNQVQDYCVPGSTDYCGSPVAQWNMDEGTGQYAQDTSGNANTGTLGTSTNADSADPVWAQGKTGKGLNFDGTNDYIDCGSASSLTSLTAITVEGWAKLDTTATRRPYVSLYTSGAAYPGFYAHYSASKPLIYMGASNYRYFNNSPVNLYDGNWHYIAFVVTGNGQNDIDNSKFYVDGREQTVQQTLKTGATSAINYCAIGRGSSYYFDGGIDQVKIYNYARTPSQIAWDYNRGKALIHLKFDEESGSVAYDASGNGTNGTITGATVSTNGKLNNALSFDGTDDFVSVTSTSSVNAISFWMKQGNTSDKSIIDLGGGYTVTLASNAITTAGFSSPTVYVDGKAGTTISDTNWHYVTVTTTTSFALTNPTIGKVSTNFFTGYLDDIKIFNYPLTSTQVKDLYNGGAIKFDK